MCETTPQFAVGAGKVTATLFDVVPDVPPEVAAVEPAASVAAKFVVFATIPTRAYDPPETSVPPPASVGADVNKAK